VPVDPAFGFFTGGKSRSLPGCERDLVGFCFLVFMMAPFVSVTACGTAGNDSPGQVFWLRPAGGTSNENKMSCGWRNRGKSVVYGL
jgi:hypothetical protein